MAAFDRSHRSVALALKEKYTVRLHAGVKFKKTLVGGEHVKTRFDYLLLARAVSAKTKPGFQFLFLFFLCVSAVAFSLRRQGPVISYSALQFVSKDEESAFRMITISLKKTSRTNTPCQ